MMENAWHLEKSESVSQDWNDTNWPLRKNNPYRSGFTGKHCLNEQVKSIKELGDRITNLHKMGVPESGMGEYLWKACPGTQC